jgi:hypothetical protein
VALALPGWGIFNNSVCQANGGFTMAFEINKPAEEAGVPFTVRFATSADLRAWRLTASACVYAKDRYTACPTLRFCNGFYYLTYLEALIKRKGPPPDVAYVTHLVRSRDLVHWESSPRNPILAASPEDKRIAVPHFTDAEKASIAKEINLNNSDMDYCEFDGQTIIYYSWGDQQGHEFLAQARCNQPLAEFLAGFW